MIHTLNPVDWGLWLSAEKLAKFDSSQVCSEMPCFKRQKAGEAFALDLCALVCVVFLSCDSSFLQDCSYHFNLLRRPLI